MQRTHWLLAAAQVVLAIALAMLCRQIHAEHQVTLSTNNALCETNARLLRAVLILEDHGVHNANTAER